MPYDPLTDEQREIRDLVRTLARERVAPRAAEIDKTAEFPWDLVELFREQEVFGILYDEEYGGLGASALMTLVAVEELSKVCATTGLIVAVQELGSLGLKLAGTEEQKQRYLPRLASGEWLCAYALTEPGSGSDSAAMRTQARREADEYVLTGSKRFITNAGVASLYTVFATRDKSLRHKGISGFIVPAKTLGISHGQKFDKMGQRASDTAEVVFEVCDGQALLVTPAGVELITLNERLRNPVEATASVAASRRMGLFVVGKLANRHGISVGLFTDSMGTSRSAPSGSAKRGVTARLTIPSGPIRVRARPLMKARPPANARHSTASTSIAAS
jgi:alkylation response protein AidB-like acyl-CoA dehydrogenase